MSIITLLTDFGTADSYVAEVKAALLSGASGATLVDVTHEVPPGDIRAAQYLLSRSWHRFPPGTVHLVVVDPGVGTGRRALAAAAGGHGFVAPDNGLLSVLPPGGRFVSLPVSTGASPTFHGRDVFAPGAARLSSGAALESLGSPVTDPHDSPLSTPHMDEGQVVGEVLYVDRFGNLISNVPGAGTFGKRVYVAGIDAGLVRRTYADVAAGEVLTYVGSGETIEIAVRDGHAGRELGAEIGAEVRLSTR